MIVDVVVVSVAVVLVCVTVVVLVGVVNVVDVSVCVVTVVPVVVDVLVTVDCVATVMNRNVKVKTMSKEPFYTTATCIRSKRVNMKRDQTKGIESAKKGAS